MTRLLWLVVTLCLLPTILFAAPEPFSAQPTNFYWRIGLYAHGWKDPNYPTTTEQQLAFLKQFDAGTNEAIEWWWQRDEGSWARGATDPPGLMLRSFDHGLEQTAGTRSRMLIQILVNQVPEWFQRKYPQELSSMDPAYIAAPYLHQNPAYINPDSPVMIAAAEDCIRTVIERYKDNPGVKGFLLGAGLSQVEMTLLPFGQRFGYGPTEVAGFRAWLRERYTLAELGKRWWGDAGKYRSWDEVQRPHMYEFFGWEGPDRVALSAHLSPAEPGLFQVRASEQPERDLLDPAWGADTAGVETLPLPDYLDQKKYLPGQTLLRKRFSLTATQVAAFRQQGGWLYGGDYDGKRVVLNGHDLGTLNGLSTKPAPGQPGAVEHNFNHDPFGVQVDPYLVEGDNVITLLGIADPQLQDPLFLSSEPPRRYPYLGAQGNARYVDLVTWQFDRVARLHARLYRLARRLAPQAQLDLFAPQGDLLDVAGRLCHEVGAGMRNTGREAWYYPWYARAGLLAGFPGNGESSGTVVSADIVRRALGWSFFDNDQALTWFWDLGQYVSEKNPAHAELLRDQHLMELFGKSDLTPPTLAFLYSSRVFQLQNFWQHPAPYLWDPGRGELQTAGIDFAYASESTLAAGLPPHVRVLLDAATEIMDDTTVAALEKWVRAGGTFIALHNTGEHSLLQANAWPISRLTGFQVTGWAPADEEITFEPGQRLWPSLETRRVGGSGQGQDWLGQNFAGGGIRLQATAAECQPVARWKDGSIAVGERALGRGRVIVLGSTFWRNARDLAGIYAPVNTQERPWLAELLAGLGVPELGQGGPWLREARSRTDGQPWLVVFNQTDTPLLGVTVNWEHGGTGVVRDLTADKAMRNLTAPRTDYQTGPGPVRSFIPVAPAQTLVSWAGPGLPGMWPGPALTLHPAEPGSQGPYAEISNWDKIVCFPGSFNLLPARAAEQEYLVLPLRGNGRPVPLAVYLYDQQGGFREYCKAQGKALSLGGTGWVTARILLSPSGGDYASGSEQAPGGTPFHLEAVERLALAPIGNWRQTLPDAAAIAALPIGLGAITLERGTVDTTLTPTIYRRADGRLVFDLEPYQTRVFAAAP